MTSESKGHFESEPPIPIRGKLRDAKPDAIARDNVLRYCRDYIAGIEQSGTATELVNNLERLAVHHYLHMGYRTGSDRNSATNPFDVGNLIRGYWMYKPKVGISTFQVASINNPFVPAIVQWISKPAFVLFQVSSITNKIIKFCKYSITNKDSEDNSRILNKLCESMTEQSNSAMVLLTPLCDTVKHFFRCHLRFQFLDN